VVVAVRVDIQEQAAPAATVPTMPPEVQDQVVAVVVVVVAALWTPVVPVAVWDY
jgi:hypothetical protein